MYYTSDEEPKLFTLLKVKATFHQIGEARIAGN
jgi:hypothetical protein